MNQVIKKQRIRKGFCAALGCTRPTTGRSFCSTCRCRMARLKDPVKYSYYNKKNRAKQRGIEFTISLEYFRKFCHETDYIGKAGRVAGSYDVDRIDETKGYVEGNIQILEKVENIKKHHEFKRTKKLDYNWMTGEAKAIDITPKPVAGDMEDYF